MIIKSGFFIKILAIYYEINNNKNLVLSKPDAGILHLEELIIVNKTNSNITISGEATGYVYDNLYNDKYYLTDDYHSIPEKTKEPGESYRIVHLYIEGTGETLIAH